MGSISMYICILYILFTLEIIRARKDREQEQVAAVDELERSIPTPTTSTAKVTTPKSGQAGKRRLSHRSSWCKGIVKKVARKTSSASQNSQNSENAFLVDIKSEKEQGTKSEESVSVCPSGKY